MSDIDVSRTAGRHKKRDVSVAAYYISESEIAKLIANGEALAADDFLLGKLPTNILVTASTTTVLVPFTVAATLTCGLVGGTGTEFANAVPLNAAADTVITGTGEFSIQTGPVVTSAFAGANLAIDGGGYAVVIVEYVEHTQCTGELTNFATP